VKLEQFFYGGDNLGYLLYTDKLAAAIDGGAVDEILDFTRQHDLRLAWATNTHAHGDHTTGTQRLVAASGAEYLDHHKYTEGQSLDLDGESVTVRLTPGHTMDSVCFAADDFLVTGDTLFNATVGNCFSGDLKAFYRSIQKLIRYPGTTRIYAGHDYVKASLAYARLLTPDNKAIDAYAARYNKTHVVSTLDEELTVNPFLRFNDPAIIDVLKAQKLPVKTEYQRWESIMSIE
jgi:hydroxyacylglutathione hydrolase